MFFFSLFKRYKILSWYYTWTSTSRCPRIISAQKWLGKCQISAEKSFLARQKRSCTTLDDFWGCNLQKPPESYKECKIFFLLSSREFFLLHSLVSGHLSPLLLKTSKIWKGKGFINFVGKLFCETLKNLKTKNCVILCQFDDFLDLFC